MILSKLKTSSKQATITVPNKVDIGCDENIMPFNVFKTSSLTPQKINNNIHVYIK